MISERDGHILGMLIREYIKTAQPVSSEKISRRLKHSLSPASVRNIFSELMDEGYIEQPHTSSGRIPSTRGYRFFVNQFLSCGNNADESNEIIQLSDIRQLQQELAKRLHVISGVSGAVPIGFDEVFDEPEFVEHKAVKELASFLNGFERFSEDYRAELEDNLFCLFIGEENEVQPTARISIMVTDTPGGELFFVAGPTRMRYEELINAVKLWKMNPKK